MTQAQSPNEPAAASRATGPPLAATTTFWVAAMATTTGMYSTAQKVTPRSVSGRIKPRLRR